MDQASCSNATEPQETCKICSKVEAKYTCPRCNILYCSLPCYQSRQHVQCSESFYKECVEENLLKDPSASADPQKMQEILERFHQEQAEGPPSDVSNDNSENELDSDDEESMKGLNERMKGVDLNDVKQVWAHLTNDEKQDFSAMLRSRELEEQLPKWDPWWVKEYKRGKLVNEDLEEVEEVEDFVEECPQILKHIPKIANLTSKPPADCVKYNLVNAIASYAYTLRFFNGEPHDCPKDVVRCFLQLSEVFRSNKNFECIKTAVESVETEILNSPWIEGDETTKLLLQKDTHRIFQGPKPNVYKFFLLSGLSDLHRLFSEAIAAPEGKKSGAKVQHLKKIEYFLAFVQDSYEKSCMNIDVLNK